MNASPLASKLSSKKKSGSKKSRKQLNTPVQQDFPVGSFKRKITDALVAEYTPIYIRIYDTSCKFLHRKLLGAKRFWFQKVKFDNDKRKWTVSIFRLPTLDSRIIANGYHQLEKISDKVTLRPTIVGYYENEKTAVVAGNEAIENRNKENPFCGEDGTNFLGFAYHVTIISEKFAQNSHYDRLLQIYEILLQIMHQKSINNQAFYMPSRYVGFSTVGQNVLNLPHFRYLEKNFVIDPRTPWQWKPHIYQLSSDKLGISKVLSKLNSIGHLIEEKEQRIEDEETKKGISAHFYHGLPKELKKMMIDEIEHQKSLVQENNLSRILVKNTEANAPRKYKKELIRLGKAATMLQRIYRSREQFKTVRRLCKRHLAALNIQRTFRGRIGRLFASNFFHCATHAAILFQSLHRSYSSRQKTIHYRLELTSACRVVQRAYRGYAARQFVEWIKTFKFSAICGQKIIRGFIARRRVAKLRKLKFEIEVRIPSTIIIQRIYRGFCGRKVYYLILEDHINKTVRIPAATQIQRIFRGCNGREKARIKRTQWNAAKRIQEAWKSFLGRKWWNMLFSYRLKEKMAIKIGSVGRGFIARKIYKLKKKRHYHKFVVTPAAVCIQSNFRGFKARNYISNLRFRTEAAVILQDAWRRKLCMRAEIARWKELQELLKNRMACRIQKLVRCYFAKSLFSSLRLVHEGKKGKAILIIQSAWQSYMAKVRAAELHKVVLIEKKAQLLTFIKNEHEMIADDKTDCMNDLKRIMKYRTKAKSRIKELQQLKIEMEIRIPEIEKELATMTVEDEERGWTEAFHTEKHVITHSFDMATEDILSRKMMIGEYEMEGESLRIELEDLEQDYDEIMAQEVQEIEYLRELELIRAKKRIELDRLKGIRKQKNKWKVKTVRKNVIRRERKKKLSEKYGELNTPVNDEIGSVSFKKRLSMKKRIRGEISAAIKQNQLEDQIQIEKIGWKNQNILGLYDQIVNSTKDIIGNYSFEMSKEKSDIRGDRSQMCWKCGFIYCECNRKEKKKK